METLKLIILGIFQGVAEFLPISSSGHLTILQKVFNFNAESSTSLNILLHIGTLISIFLVYYKDIINLIGEGFMMLWDLIRLKPNFKKNENRNFILMIILSCIPTGILGLVISEFEDIITANTKIVSALLIVTAIILYLSTKIHIKDKSREDITWIDGLLIGIVQGIAVLPGISRSGSTITASLGRGLNKETAIKFSFFMSIPVIILAAVKDFLMDGGFESFQFNYIYATLAAIIAGYLSIKLLIKMLKDKDFGFFAWYCLAVGIITLILV